MRAVLAALAAACLTSPLAAQAAADSAPRPTPFRAGQWGMEVSISQGIYGVGVLRFTSPTRAWLLDGIARSAWRRAISDVPDDSAGASRDSWDDNWENAVSLLVGQRAYRPMGGRALRIVQGGVRVGVQHDRRRVRGPIGDYDDRFAIWSAGVEGGIGATLRLDDDLTLGTLVSGSVSYSGRRTRRPEGRYTFDAVSATLEPARLYLTLFF